MKDKNRGKFIVFEGIDGSGKTSQIIRLAERLRREGRRVYITAEPTETVTGGLLRDALSGSVRRTPAELAALFLIDRINHNVNAVNGIRKLISEGTDVICDRYYYSSMAYQGSETDPLWVESINLNCPEISKPDLCIFLDLDPEICLERIGSDRAFTEIYEKKQKLEAVRARYFSVFEKLRGRDRIEIIDSTGDITAVAEAIYRAVCNG